jgi:hypothetical protein
MNNKHYMIYYHRGTGTFVTTAPRAWARENQNRFLGRNFDDDHPTSDEVEEYLVRNHGFTLVVHNEQLVTLVYNLNPNLNL